MEEIDFYDNSNDSKIPPKILEYKYKLNLPLEIEKFLLKKYDYYSSIYIDGIRGCSCGYVTHTDAKEDFLLYSKNYPFEKDLILNREVGTKCPNCGKYFLWRDLTFIDIDNKIYIGSIEHYELDKAGYKFYLAEDLDDFEYRMNKLGFYS
jgi:hypothetical protein